MSARPAGRLGSWLSVRHSLRAEAAVVLVLYGLYELARGMVVGDAAEAVRHARQLVTLERSTGVFIEERMQDAAHAFPGLIDLLSISYLTFHLAVTVAVLLWLHRRRSAAFPLIRTTLVIASGLALVGYLVYPTAPPRMAGIGIADTVSNGHVDLNSGLVSSFYNPYAAVPSMHFGYALVAGVAVAWLTSRRLVQVAAAFYPAFVLFVIVATGNHFLLDALAGAVVVGVAAGGALLLARPTADAAGLARFLNGARPARRQSPQAQAAEDSADAVSAIAARLPTNRAVVVVPESKSRWTTRKTLCRTAPTGRIERPRESAKRGRRSTRGPCWPRDVDCSARRS